MKALTLLIGMSLANNPLCLQLLTPQPILSIDPFETFLTTEELQRVKAFQRAFNETVCRRMTENGMPYKGEFDLRLFSLERPDQHMINSVIKGQFSDEELVKNFVWLYNATALKLIPSRSWAFGMSRFRLSKYQAEDILQITRESLSPDQSALIVKHIKEAPSEDLKELFPATPCRPSVY